MKLARDDKVGLVRGLTPSFHGSVECVPQSLGSVPSVTTKGRAVGPVLSGCGVNHTRDRYTLIFLSTSIGALSETLSLAFSVAHLAQDRRGSHRSPWSLSTQCRQLSNPRPHRLSLGAEHNIDENGTKLPSCASRHCLLVSPAANAQKFGPARKVVAIQPAREDHLGDTSPRDG